MPTDTLNYLHGLERVGIKLGLETMHALMDILGHPECGFKAIHVTGTNGKGSTCAFIDSVLRKAGYTVGLYTSPHLIRFNERICVNGEEISDRELIHFTELIKCKLEEENKKRTDKLEPTFFEFTTAVAFLYFASKNVDFDVVEVGMGGEFDATNTLYPLVAVLTNVSLDHTNVLGGTVQKIARTKAGIIKKLKVENGKLKNNSQLSTLNSQLKVIAIEQSEKIVPYDKVDYEFPMALVVGHETEGVSKEVLKIVDQIVEIPMWGINKSLNVMVSLGIVLYKIMEYK